MLNVGVENFGPIREGNVALRPLTIFVGPNNSGKSYLASLAYALSDPFSSPGLSSYQRLVEFFSAAFDTNLGKEVREWFSRRGGQRSVVRFAELPDEVGRYIDQLVSEFIQRFGWLYEQKIQYCFGSPLTDLARKRSKNDLRLSLAQSKPPLRIEMILKAGDLQMKSSKCDLSDQEIDLTPFTQTLDVAEKIGLSLPVLNLLPSVLVAPIFGNLFRGAYHFPAARTGFLQSYLVLASAVMKQIPLLGIEPLEVQQLPGFAADFISKLLTLPNLSRRDMRDRPHDIPEVGSFLETQISKGKIDIMRREEFPVIYYESDDGRFLMHQVSTSVAELAPIVLFLKYLVKQGDLLIIEEPEAHLHPDNQRNLARAIVKLIRRGVHVLITTHSDYFVQQISNFILLGKLPDQRVKVGYSADDYLQADEVGAYLFHFDKRRRGSLIKELEVTEEDGIPEDQFIAIAEEIYNETVRLRQPSA